MTSSGPGHRKCRDRRAAGQRLELHDAEGVGEARENEHVGRGQMRGQILRPSSRRGRRLSDISRCSAAFCGPSPITTLVPGRSSDRNASRFFSTATRPTVMKIGRGRSSSAGSFGTEQLGVDAARPEAELAEAALAQAPAAARSVATMVIAAAA